MSNGSSAMHNIFLLYCNLFFLFAKRVEHPKGGTLNYNTYHFWILKRALHATHLLKLLDKMCKYEMDPMSIVEDTERTRFCPQTDRRTDGRTDRRTDGQGDTSIPPYQLRWSWGYNNSLWLSDIMWQHYRSGSTVVQVMACCLTTPSHYLNQWL